MSWTRTATLPGDTPVIRYWPSALVSVRDEVPTTETCAPWIGPWLAESVTVPRIDPCCASSVAAVLTARTAVASAIRTCRVRFMALPR